MSRKRNPQTQSGKRSQNIKKFLTKKGCKLVLPTKTNKESEVIQKHLESLQQLLEICVPHLSNLKRKSLMECEIENNDSFGIVVTKPRGKSLYTMGTSRNKKIYLQPEQALWLAQQKKLIIFYQQKILETQQLFNLMIKHKKVSFQEFLCFSNLTRAGYVVWRLSDLPSPKIILYQKTEKGTKIQKINKENEKENKIPKEKEIENEKKIKKKRKRKMKKKKKRKRIRTRKRIKNKKRKRKRKRKQNTKRKRKRIRTRKRIKNKKRKGKRKGKEIGIKKEKDNTFEFEISYVVFKKKKNFRKREPGKPVMYLVCLSNKQPPPDQNQLKKLKTKYCEAPIVFGIVDQGSVLFCEFQDLELEDLSANY